MFKEKNAQVDLGSPQSTEPTANLSSQQPTNTNAKASSSMNTNASAITNNSANSSSLNSSKGKFQSELETLKKYYEQEKQSRIELEKLAKTLLASIDSLQQQVKSLTETNQQLMKACNL